MAELLPAALGWIDEKKRQALNTIKQALAEAQANPIESTVANALRGVGRGALSMGEMAAKPFDPLGLSAGVTDKILPSNGSAVGDIAEFLGPPMKMGAKVAMATVPFLGKVLKEIEVGGHLFPKTPEGATPLFLTKEGEPIGNAASGMDSHGKLLNDAGLNNDPMTADALGLHYVDSGSPDKHLIIATPNSTYANSVAVAHDYAAKSGVNVELHHGGNTYDFGGTKEIPFPKVEWPSAPFVPAGEASSEAKNMLLAHGFGQEQIAKRQRYTMEQPETMLGRLEVAQLDATLNHGLPPGNTPFDRALAMKYTDPTDLDALSGRGSKTYRTELQTPVAGGFRSTNSPRNMDAVFISDPGSQFHESYPVQTPLVTKTPREAFFDPANLEHQAQFKAKYDELYPNAGGGSMHTGTTSENPPMTSDDILSSINNWQGPGGPGSPREAWDTLESHPAITETIKQLGFPGFLTEESGPNRAFFDPTELRHPLADFNMSNAGVRNLFASAGGVTALAALLAQQNLPIDAPAQ